MIEEFRGLSYINKNEQFNFSLINGYYRIKETLLLGGDVYGIKIITKHISKKTTSIQQNSFYNLTTNKNFIDQIIFLLKINTVSAISLGDIVSDMGCFNKKICK